eukprot:2175403-Rhodomonas_salina.1
MAKGGGGMSPVIRNPTNPNTAGVCQSLSGGIQVGIPCHAGQWQDMIAYALLSRNSYVHHDTCTRASGVAGITNSNSNTISIRAQPESPALAFWPFLAAGGEEGHA